MKKNITKQLFAELMPVYRNKSVLITGGLGFIGSNLARLLHEFGAIVTVVDSLIPQYGGNLFNINGIQKKININICDVRDMHALRFLLEGKDFLFNLAGQTSHVDSMADPKTDLEINAAAQLSILETCRLVNKSIKIVFASTRQLYGRPEYLPVNELHPVRPVDVNGVNKLAGEKFHILYNDIYGIKSCALRLTNTYGPRMRVKDARQTFLGIWIRLLIEGKPIKVFGDGMQLRDFNYVDDCIMAMLMAGAKEVANGKTYNLGSRQIINLKGLAELMIDIFGNGTFEIVPFPHDRIAIDIGDYYSDFSLIQNELGWSPTINLEDGLASTIDYYKLHSNKYWEAT